MTWDEFTRCVEVQLQMTGRSFDRRDLCLYVEAMAPHIDALPDAALWAGRFQEMLRERADAAAAG